VKRLGLSYSGMGKCPSPKLVAKIHFYYQEIALKIENKEKD